MLRLAHEPGYVAHLLLQYARLSGDRREVRHPQRAKAKQPQVREEATAFLFAVAVG